MKDNDLAQNMSKFIDCKYSLGDTSEGWDCLSFIIDLYETMGFQFPQEYKGITRKNYAKIWNKGGGRKEFEEVLLLLGKHVNVLDIRRGDLLIFKTPNGPAPGIYTGNGNIHVITEKGGKSVPLKILKMLKFECVNIRRLI